MRACLHRKERERVDAYASMVPGECGDIAQNPKHKALVSRNGELGTIIKNVGLLWAQVVDRWICRVEMLAAMGFPITAAHVKACSGITCSYTEGNLPPLTRSHCTEGATCGNAFHVNSVGAVCMSLLVLFPSLDDRHLEPPRRLLAARISSSSIDSDDMTVASLSAASRFSQQWESKRRRVVSGP